MYLLILVLPFTSFIILALFGRFFSKSTLLYINICCMFLSVLISLLMFYEVVLCQAICNVTLTFWIHLILLNITWSFLFDSLSVIMAFIILFISCFVHIYSIEYMYSDPFLIRFMSYLSLFTFFMLILISAGNFVQLFLGWEGVGLSSYLLINFWFTRIQANKAAIKAILMNRFGDAGLYLSIALTLYYFGSADFQILLGSTAYCDIGSGIIKYDSFSYNWVLTLISFCIFIGAMGKSAQLGLHTWLPDAMEGPTPVSALIHAATMVTAGVFVLIRLGFLLELSPNVLLFVALIGGLTAFFAGSIGSFQYDLKKVIAYSTCSQLGYMVFACGLSNYTLGLFHLYNHAFFKALLFLGAGSIIHGLSDEQDMRKMGGLYRLLPVTYVAMFIGCITLIGIPFLSGFYSKDLILEYAFVMQTSTFYFGYVLCLIAVVFTTMYSLRLFFLTFFNFIANFNSGIKPIESGVLILSVLCLLACVSVCIGFLSKDLFSSFFPLQMFNGEFLPLYIKLFPLCCILVGGIMWVFSYFVKIPFGMHHFFNQKWYFDLFYNNFVVFFCMKFGYVIGFKLIDRGVLEYFGSTGVANLYNTICLYHKLYSGYVYHYIFILWVFIMFSILIIFIIEIPCIIFYFCSIFLFFYSVCNEKAVV
jgi:proton-translocating NADH-quinone oxidoreductase chain L